MAADCHSSTTGRCNARHYERNPIHLVTHNKIESDATTPARFGVPPSGGLGSSMTSDRINAELRTSVATKARNSLQPLSCWFVILSLIIASKRKSASQKTIERS